jgi:hypothetical protein
MSNHTAGQEALREPGRVQVHGGIAQLREIRSSVYEDVNQIQHEYLLLRGLEWLLDNGFDSKAVWEWNPRQTGSGIEPDLMGSVDGTTLVSAETCTSENPLGMADSRMRDRLEELSRMEGQKFYFVGAAGMVVRAGTKARKAQWAITVVQDSLSFAPARERS